MPSHACERKARLLSRLQRQRLIPVLSFLYKGPDGHESPDAAPLLTAHFYDPEVKRYLEETMTCLEAEQKKVFVCKLHQLHSRDKDKKNLDPCFDKFVLGAARAVQLEWVTARTENLMALLKVVVGKPVTPDQSYPQLLEMPEIEFPWLCDTALKSLSRRWCIDELAEYAELAGGSAAAPPASAPATLGPCGLPAEFELID